MRKAIIGAVFTAMAFCGAGTAAAQSYNLTLAGASPGGLWSLLGAGIDAAVKAEYPGSTVTYQTSGGGLANVVLLQRNSAELGIIHDAELLVAKNGDEPFKQPITSLRALGYLYTWAPMQVLVSASFAEKYGIETFSDLAAKKAPARIVLNKRGNIASPVGEAMLRAIGATPAKIEEWGGQVIYAASSEQATLMQDRRIDVIINSIFVRHRSVMQAADAVDLKLLALSDETISKVGAETGTTAYTIKGGSYAFAPEDVRTVTLGAALVVNEAMSDDDAYNLTKAIFENIDKIRGVHKAMRELTPEIMASLEVIPYHDGALRYLKEAGLR